MATPSANRRRNVFKGEHSQSQQSLLTQQELEKIPPSSCTHVPASSIKASINEVVERNSVTLKRCLMPTIEQTPTKGPSKFSQLDVAAKPKSVDESTLMTPSTVMNARRSASGQDTSQKSEFQKPPWTGGVQATPSRKASTDPDGHLPKVIFEGTPVKQLKPLSANVLRASYNTALSPASNDGVSIYKSLGWDDDVDELM